MRIAALLPVVLLAGCASDPFHARITSGRPSVRVAEVALNSGATETALQMARGILNDEPDNVPALVVEGRAEQALGQLDAAETSFQKALSIKPNAEGALLGLGRIRLAKDPSAAEAVFQKVLSNHPQNAAALTDIGVARDLQGQHDKAQTSYRQALKLSPSLLSAQVDLGLSLALAGQTHEALAILQPLASDGTAPTRVRHDLATALALSGDTQDAEQVLAADLPPTQVQAALDGFKALK